MLPADSSYMTADCFSFWTICLEISFRGIRDLSYSNVGLKATLINTDNETKRFRINVPSNCTRFFVLLFFPLTRNFHNGDDSFVYFCMLWISFCFLYTKIKRKNVQRERFHVVFFFAGYNYTAFFCFLLLAFSLRKTQSLGWFVISFVSIATSHGFKYL